MLKVLDKLPVGGIYCVSVEGDTSRLKSGLKVIDEKENIFEIETVAMTCFKDIEDLRRHAELVLKGNVENIGEQLELL